MKLRIVPARTGLAWATTGMKTFFRQPLALAGLFFIFMATVSVLSLIPLLGSVLALVLLPGATLGLMAATAQAHGGKFPMPSVILTGFRAGPEKLRAMLILGLLYALGFLLVLGLCALVDDGKFARLYLLGEGLSSEGSQNTDLDAALVLAMVLYLPLSLMFWHAPALVHWHGVSPLKSLFFSLIACGRNLGAFLVYGLVWLAVFLGVGIVIALVSAIAGNPELASALMLPTAMLMAAMFFTSIYFSYLGCFETEEGEKNASPHATGPH
jgi:hypothetical protein